MEYLTVHEASELWNISERRIINLLNNKRIPGAYKIGRRWCIPKGTSKPIDRRTSFSNEQIDKKVVVIAGINSEMGKELTKILLEKGLQKQDLVEHAGLSSATVAKMGRGEPVSNKVLEKVCAYLECSVNDIISYE